MATRTRIFKSGNSRAVRIPKESMLETDDVVVQRVGSALVVIPAEDPWSAFRTSLDMFSNDFLRGGREQGPDQDRDVSGTFD